MSVKKIKKICVIGAGYWGKNHINTLNKLNCLSGIYDSEKSKTAKIKEKLPAITVYSNFQQLLDDETIDGVIVATPAHTHFEISKRLIESKKHLLVEKPFTLRIDHAETLID